MKFSQTKVNQYNAKNIIFQKRISTALIEICPFSNPLLNSKATVVLLADSLCPRITNCVCGFEYMIIWKCV